MTSGWHLVLIKCKYEPRIIPFLLAFLRIAICFWPQTGYLHPDEFFQSTDISAGRYFESNVQRVWEFTVDKPIRCMLIPNILNTIAFKLATLFQSNPSAYLLLVAPRLVYTLLSFTVDACLYKLCQYYSSRGLWYLPVSIIFQSSFVCLGCMTRTFSNVPEVVLFAILLVVVCQLIKPRFRILFVTPTRSTPVNERIKTSTQLTSSLLIGIIVTLGIFNRPTFPCFALVPLLYWFAESLKRNSYDISLTIKRVLLPVVISATLSVILLTSYDTVYYKGFQTVKDLLHYLLELNINQFYSHLCSNWIVTPYNFIKYNTDVDNLAKYGLHSPYMHMLVNIPFAFSVLGVKFYGKLVDLMMGSGVYRLVFSAHRIYALMLLSTLTSTILLSFIPHQEFRFLLPLIVPLTYAFAFNVYASNKWLSIWLLFNFILITFYTTIHQAGVIRASLDLDPILRSYITKDSIKNATLVDVMAFRCYLVPSYQWNIPKEDNRFRLDLHDTIEDFHESVDLRLGASLARHLDYSSYDHKLFIMLPHLYVKQFENYMKGQFLSNVTNLRTLKQYAFHFSGEEFHTSIDHIRKFGLKGVKEAFGFTLMQADLINEAKSEN